MFYFLYNRLLICFLLFCSPSAVGYEKNDCDMGIKSMSFCLPYLVGSTVVPSRSCCKAFVFILDRNSSCVCRLFNQTYARGVQLNSTQLLSLGGLCGKSSSLLATCTGKTNNFIFRENYIYGY